MFITQAFKAKHEFWRYLIGSGIVFIASVVGQLPMVGALILAGGSENGVDMEGMFNILGQNTTLFFILFSFLVGLIAMFVVIRFLHQQDIREVTTSRPRVDWKRILGMFSVMMVIIGSVTVLDYFANPQDYIWNFKWRPFLILCLIAIPLIPVQTSLEEYIFRGYLMQGFGVLLKNRWFPLLMTSLIFGLLHMFNPEVQKLGPLIMCYYIGTGLFLGIMTLMDEGMELALGFHAANNLATALLVTADWTALQTHSILKDISEPSIGPDVFIPLLVIYPIVLLILARRYKWKNWKEKLFGPVPLAVPVNRPEN